MNTHLTLVVRRRESFAGHKGLSPGNVYDRDTTPMERKPKSALTEETEVQTDIFQWKVTVEGIEGSEY